MGLQDILSFIVQPRSGDCHQPALPCLIPVDPIREDQADRRCQPRGSEWFQDATWGKQGSQSKSWPTYGFDGPYESPPSVVFHCCLFLRLSFTIIAGLHSLIAFSSVLWFIQSLVYLIAPRHEDKYTRSHCRLCPGAAGCRYCTLSVDIG